MEPEDYIELTQNIEVVSDSPSAQLITNKKKKYILLIWEL